MCMGTFFFKLQQEPLAFCISLVCLDGERRWIQLLSSFALRCLRLVSLDCHLTFSLDEKDKPVDVNAACLLARIDQRHTHTTNTQHTLTTHTHTGGTSDTQKKNQTKKERANIHQSGCLPNPHCRPNHTTAIPSPWAQKNERSFHKPASWDV